MSSADGQNGVYGEDELQHILAMVSAEDRAQMRRVSRLFNKTFTRIGYHLDPLFMRNHLSIEDLMPYYTNKIAIKPNLRVFEAGTDEETRGYCSPRPKRQPCAELDRRRTEFVTALPISTCVIFAMHNRDFVKTLFRTAGPNTKRPEGIRVGDLLDIFDKLNEQETQPLTPEERVRQWGSFRIVYAMSDEVGCTPSDLTGAENQDTSTIEVDASGPCLYFEPAVKKAYLTEQLRMQRRCVVEL